MPRCRFFDGHHDYTQDECDRAYCREVLPKAHPRVKPLHLDQDPKTCPHPHWLVYFSRMKLPMENRKLKDWAEDLDVSLDKGRLLMTDHTFQVCELCGAVVYQHPELGKHLTCLPEGDLGGRGL